MKILVTGATGFIGRHLIPCLVNRGYVITAVARNPPIEKECPWLHLVRFIPYDIHSLDAKGSPFGKQDAVIHLAWTGLPNYGKLFHFEENLPADYRFLKSLVVKGVRHILVTGTCFEYGMKEGCLTEDMSTEPANSYALAKDTLRKFLQLLQQEYTFTMQWARLFYMYGPGQPQNSLLGQLEEAIQKEEATFNMSGGKQLRDYLPVEEVARRLANLFEHPSCNGIVNLSSSQPISVAQLVERRLGELGAKIRLNLGYYPYSEFEPMAFWGGSEKYWRYCKDV